MTERRRSRRGTLVLALLGALIVPAPAPAHEIPNDVTIQAFLKPEGQTLRLLVRVPLVAMRDMDWPSRTPGILDLDRAANSLRNAGILWIAQEAMFHEGDRLLTEPRPAAARASLRTDRSFESYDIALALVTGPPEPSDTVISIDTDFLDVLFEYPIQSDRSRFSFDSRWARLGQQTLIQLRLLLPDGQVRAFDLEGNPGLVRLDPTWYQAIGHFATLGFRHFAGTTDYLLFVAALVIPLRRVASVVLVALGFAAGHSITLFAAVSGFTLDTLWFMPLIDMLVAVAVLYTACENLIGAENERRWKSAFIFGPIFGFALWFVLHPILQFGGAHQILALTAFNLGVEAALLLLLLVISSLVALLFRYVVAERTGTIILSAIIAHTAWHQMLERGSLLRQYRFMWPELTPAFLADLLRWLIFVVAMGGVMWLASVLRRSWRSGDRPGLKSRA